MFGFNGLKRELKRSNDMMEMALLTMTAQRKHIDGLLDRLMAKNYIEYKSYKNEIPTKPQEYPIVSDEEVAGEVV